MGMQCSDPRSSCCWVPLRLRRLKWEGNWKGDGSGRLPRSIGALNDHWNKCFQTSLLLRRRTTKRLEGRFWLLVLFTGYSYFQKFRPSSQVSTSKFLGHAMTAERLRTSAPFFDKAKHNFKGWMH